MDYLLPLPTNEVEFVLGGVRARWKFSCRGNWRNVALEEQEDLAQKLRGEPVDGYHAVLKAFDLVDQRLEGIRGVSKLYKCPR